MSDDNGFAKTHARKDDLDTSKISARLAEPHASAQKKQILKALERYGPMTSEEITRKTSLNLWQCGRRVPDLRKAGLVIDTGERRKNESGRPACVWAVAEDQSELQFDQPPKQRSRKSLEDEIERLRAALRFIERTASQYSGTAWVRVEDIAKEALGDE